MLSRMTAQQGAAEITALDHMKEGQR